MSVTLTDLAEKKKHSRHLLDILVPRVPVADNVIQRKSFYYMFPEYA